MRILGLGPTERKGNSTIYNTYIHLLIPVILMILIMIYILPTLNNS